MPTGTYVQTRLWLYKGKNVMEVDIFPSRADIGKSEGLCSKLGSKKRLFKRDGTEETYSFHPNTFSLSWRYSTQNYASPRIYDFKIAYRRKILLKL